MARQCLVAAILCGSAVTAWADTLHLLNGEKLEGLVIREDSSTVELDIGYGTVTIERSRIRRIVRPPKRKRGAAGRRDGRIIGPDNFVDARAGFI